MWKAVGAAIVAMALFGLSTLTCDSRFTAGCIIVGALVGCAALLLFLNAIEEGGPCGKI